MVPPWGCAAPGAASRRSDSCRLCSGSRPEVNAGAIPIRDDRLTPVAPMLRTAQLRGGAARGVASSCSDSCRLCSGSCPEVNAGPVPRRDSRLTPAARCGRPVGAVCGPRSWRQRGRPDAGPDSDTACSRPGHRLTAVRTRAPSGCIAAPATPSRSGTEALTARRQGVPAHAQPAQMGVRPCKACSRFGHGPFPIGSLV